MHGFQCDDSICSSWIQDAALFGSITAGQRTQQAQLERQTTNINQAQ
jgi:hypothetical protein